MKPTILKTGFLTLAAGLFALAISYEAQAGHINHQSPLLTQKQGANALRLNGETYTLSELIAKRDLNPTRFDRYHHRLGHALSLGREGLLARRAINPSRFDHYHPYITYLMRDPSTGVEGLMPNGGSSLLPPLPPLPPLVVPDPLVPPTNPSITVVPEPASLVMISMGVGSVLWLRRRRSGKA